MDYVIKQKRGPYNGPFSKNIITYFLVNKDGDLIMWHEGPNKALNAEVGDIVSGIILKENNVVDYKNSNIKIVVNQLKLGL